MRARTFRHESIDTRSLVAAQRTDSEVAASFGAVLVIAAAVWAVANPLLAVGAIVAVLGIALLVRFGVGVATRRRRRRPARRARAPPNAD